MSAHACRSPPRIAVDPTADVIEIPQLFEAVKLIGALAAGVELREVASRVMASIIHEGQAEPQPSLSRLLFRGETLLDLRAMRASAPINEIVVV